MTTIGSFRGRLSGTFDFGWPQAWSARELKDDARWRVTVDPDVIALLRSRGGEEDVLLAELRARLEGVREELEFGSGVTVLSGLRAAYDSFREASLLFWRLGSALGTPIRQNGTGPYLGHVLNQLGGAELKAHNDGCDLLTLLCISQVRDGGSSRIWSARAVARAVFEADREAVLELQSPFPFAVEGEFKRATAGEVEWLRPMEIVGGDIHVMYHSMLIRAAGERGGPVLTDRQESALRLLERAIAETEPLEFQLVPGDMLVFNDRVVYHGRSTFRPTNPLDRHMLRLWLQSDYVGRRRGAGVVEGE